MLAKQTLVIVSALALALAVSADANPAAAAADTEVGFNSHVQPILSEYCYHCHGPDSGTREPKDAPLRLDREADAFALRSDGPQPIVKGDPAASSIITRMRHHNEELLMPPPASHKTMAEEDILTVEKWITQGAVYQKHWSFISPEKASTPTLSQIPATWVKNPIDSFVAATLEEKALTPNEPEAAHRLLRRLSQDITGLPPRREDIDPFIQAYSVDPDSAVSAVVDQLLATDGHAEHMTRHWLDAARYGDTHGIHMDDYRAIWPYRDWVIRAFQQNMPFDQFTIEQLGGDLMEDPTLDQIVATGFSRCLPTTGEMGALADEYDAIYAQDRTDTTAAIYLGLTMGCAACHDHKFDPISQKDVYSFNAFFRNTTMQAMDRNHHYHKPSVFVPRHTDRPRLAQLQTDKSALQTQLQEREKDAESEFQQWLASATTYTELHSLTRALEVHLPLDSDAPDQVTAIINGQEQTIEKAFQKVPGPTASALALASSDLRIPGVANFDFSDTVSYGGYIYFGNGSTDDVVGRYDESTEKLGWRIGRGWGNSAHFLSGTEDRDTFTTPDTHHPLKTWAHYWIDYDGTKPDRQRLQLFINGQLATTFDRRHDMSGTLANAAPLILGTAHGPSSDLTESHALQDFRFYQRSLSDQELQALVAAPAVRNALAKPAAIQTPEDTQALRRHYFRSIDPLSLGLHTSLTTIEREIEQLTSRGSMSLIMEEVADRAPTAHILNRGVYSDIGEKVGASVPEILPPLPEGETPNRLALGKWLVSPENPLTARVTMNRFWYYHFGQGLVSSNADFGIMGSRPSHPELLDWLAVEFMESGWDQRHMIKLITTSATYRQNAQVTAEKAEKDGQNIWLSRGPRYRMDAEQIRDLALSSSGLLAPDLGGPSVHPYQPDGVWSAVAMSDSNTRFYKQDTGKSLYRRSLYSFWKRTAPLPSLEIFNAPSREVFCVQRDRTNTPLQAFVTLNDTQFVEAARHLGQRALTQADSFSDRLALITESLISRTLTAQEQTIVRTTFDDNLAHYTAHPEAADQLIRQGESPLDTSLDSVQLAAWTITASQIFNLDETLTK